MSITKKGVKRQYGIEPGLVLWLPFDGDVRDYSGNSNHGLNYGASWATGKVGNTLSFDGVNNYVKTVSFGLSGTALTVSAWVKCALSTTMNQTILSDAAQSATIGYIFTYRGISSNMLVWQYAGGNDWYNAGAANFFLGYDNVLLHVTVVCDYTNKIVYFYRNGALFSTVAMSGTPVFPSTNRSRYIGTYSGTSSFFLGIIDEVRIYNRALRADEIWDLYQRGL